MLMSPFDVRSGGHCRVATGPTIYMIAAFDRQKNPCKFIKVRPVDFFQNSCKLVPKLTKKGTNEMSKMSRYVVYQLPFENPKIRDLSFMNPFEIEEISDQFEVVATVDARSLEEVFRIGNFIVEEDKTLIDIVGDMHSISVGDIIHNLETDETHVVDKIGYVKINMKEAV